MIINNINNINVMCNNNNNKCIMIIILMKW